MPSAARAAPYEKGTETLLNSVCRRPHQPAARAAPYEKGTETSVSHSYLPMDLRLRARPPMRRGLKRSKKATLPSVSEAARAAPYEKGTDT